MKAKNPNAKLFRIYDQGNNVTSNTRASDKYIQNAAYLRVKNITLAYSFPKNWVQKAFMKDAKIYLSIENPFTFLLCQRDMTQKVMNIMRLYGIIHIIGQFH